MNNNKESGNERKDNVIQMNRTNGYSMAYSRDGAPVWFVKSRSIVYYILGLIEILLAMRFLFMLLGANPRSGFTAFLYSITGIFISPFSGIFNPVTTSGLVSSSVFDPAAIIAMAVYALIAWGIVRLLWIKVSREY